MKFSNAKIEDIDQRIVDTVRKNITKDQDGKPILKKGFVFYGPTGRGKTYAMHAIKNWFGSAFGYQSRIDTWQEVNFAMSLHYGDNKAHPNAVALLNDKDVIYIDDLGMEKATDNSDQLLFMIINNAIEMEKPFFISTNLTLEQLNSRYGERITTRFIGDCELVEFTGENKRLK